MSGVSVLMDEEVEVVLASVGMCLLVCGGEWRVVWLWMLVVKLKSGCGRGCLQRERGKVAQIGANRFGPAGVFAFGT